MQVKPAPVEDDVEVDIVTAEKVGAFSDSDDSEDGLYFLPTGPLPDPPADQSRHQSSSKARSGSTESKSSPVFDAEDECNPDSSHFQHYSGQTKLAHGHPLLRRSRSQIRKKS